MSHQTVMTVVNALKILNSVEENFQTGFKYVLPYSSVFGGTPAFSKKLGFYNSFVQICDVVNEKWKST